MQPIVYQIDSNLFGTVVTSRYTSGFANSSLPGYCVAPFPEYLFEAGVTYSIRMYDTNSTMGYGSVNNMTGDTLTSYYRLVEVVTDYNPLFPS
jgi:hypothetical protein